MTPEELARLQASATRPRRTVPVVLDGDLRDRVEALETKLEAEQPAPGDRRLGTHSSSAPDSALVVELDALRVRAEAATLHIVVEGLAGTPWRALLAAHPPRRDEAGKIIPEDSLGANEETIRDPMLRASIIGHRPDPDADEVVPFDAEFVEWLIGFVTDRQKDKLVAAALKVSRGDDAVPLPQLPSTTPTSVDG